jgi:hypothetical protein
LIWCAAVVVVDITTVATSLRDWSVKDASRSAIAAASITSSVELAEGYRCDE